MMPTTRQVATIVRPWAVAARKASPRRILTIVGWHRFDSGGGLANTIDAFQRHLDLLEESGAVVLPLVEAVARLATKTLPQRAVALTFDDGYASVAESAWPLLKGRNMPATLFVVSDHLDGKKSFEWDRAEAGQDRFRLLDGRAVLDVEKDGLHIGSHTRTHPWLPALSAPALRNELSGSRRMIEDLLGHVVDTVAYPTGGWNKEVRSAASDAGYTVGITVDRGVNTAHQNPLSLRRTFLPDDARDASLILAGAYTWLRPIDTWRTRNGPRW